MQQPTIKIRDKLLTGLDKDYNVTDVGIVVQVLSELENTPITKEALEVTRLGKHINELRRKANDRHLASRAKNLVKKWRKLLVNSEAAAAAAAAASTPATTPPSTAPTPLSSSSAGDRMERVNGHKAQQQQQLLSSVPSPLVSPALSASSGGPTATAPTTIRTTTAAAAKAHTSSSLPSSASTSPGLSSSSRPATPVQAGGGGGGGGSSSSRPVSPHSGGDTTAPAVPRTNVANKRLRKYDPDPEVTGGGGEPPSKRSHLSNGFASGAEVSPPLSAFLADGENTRDSFISVASSQGATTCDIPAVPPKSTSPHGNNNNHQHTPATSPPVAPAMVMTRRKTRRSMDRGPDVLEQQMLSVRKGAGKVRTTQEIVQELALRSHSPGLSACPATTAAAGSSDGEECKTELINRLLESHTNLPGSTHSSSSVAVSPALSNVPTPSESPSPTPAESREVTPPVEESPRFAVPDPVEAVMASLPVISASEVMEEWEEAVAVAADAEGADEEEDEDEVEMEGLIPVKKPEIEVTEEMVSKLHCTPMENFNGNFDHRGEFREWHEMLTKETVGGDLLHVLPYSVID